MRLKIDCLLFLLIVSLRPALTQEVNVTTEINDIVENKTVVPKQTFKEAEKEITDFINSLLRSILPKVVSGSGSASLSPRCTAGMMKIFGSIRRLKGWTLKLLDSMGKPTAGILTGTSYSMGSYDECINLAVTKKGEETTDPNEEMFRGMYCKIRVRFSDPVIETAKSYHKGMVNASGLGKLKDIIQEIPYIPIASDYMNHYLGMCLPSSCNSDDVRQLIKLIPFPGSSALERCEVKSETEVDRTQMAIMCAFLFLFVLVCASSFIDWILHSGKENVKLNKDDKRCVSVTVAFSFCNNTKRLLKNINDDGEGLLLGNCVRGVVVASVVWIILGHTYVFPFKAFYMQASSLEYLRNYLEQYYFSFVLNFPLAYDALFVCNGFLLTFPFWYSSSKSQEVKVNVIYLVIKNYIRLCLPLLLCLGITVLLPLIGSGPFWQEILGDTVFKCRANAWAHIGMYSNFLSESEQCLPHLWYVSCLAQLTLIGIFFAWILSKSAKVGIFLIVIAVAGCNAAVGIITLKNEFPPSYIAYFTENSSSLFWKINLALPLSHFGPYAAGMLAGILIARRIHHKIRFCVGGLGWIVCLGLIYGIVLVTYKHRDESLSAYWSAVYASNHRTIFALCVAWVMIACSFGIGGFVNAILSWKVLDPLYRLSYYAFLFHFVLITTVLGVARERFFYSHLELLLRTVSYVGATYFISYFLFFLLEMPLKSLQAGLCPRRTRQIDVTPLNNFSLDKGYAYKKNTIQGSCKLWSITETHNGISY